jgi:hypothetical protein
VHDFEEIPAGRVRERETFAVAGRLFVRVRGEGPLVSALNGELEIVYFDPATVVKVIVFK